MFYDLNLGQTQNNTVLIEKEVTIYIRIAIIATPIMSFVHPSLFIEILKHPIHKRGSR